MQQLRNQSFLTRVVAALVTIGITAAAVFLGAFLLAAFVGLAAIASLVLAARVWWIRRKMQQGGRSGGADDSRVIEGEYTVQHERKRESR